MLVFDFVKLKVEYLQHCKSLIDDYYRSNIKQRIDLKGD